MYWLLLKRSRKKCLSVSQCSAVLHFELPSSMRNRPRNHNYSVCMKTRCVLQEQHSENEDRGISLLFSYAELTFYDFFSCRNDNSELAINTYCFQIEGLIFWYLSLFIPSSVLISCYFSLPKFRFSPRHEATSCDLPVITPQRFVDCKSFLGQLAL